MHVFKASQHLGFMTIKPRYRRENIFCQDSKKSFKMVKKSGSRNSVVGSVRSHRCSLSCLGPLTFHHQAVGDMVRLSQGCRLAERSEGTFKNGLVFSSRPVKIQERVHLRVEKNLLNWHGALRVGFTTVSPVARGLPLPCLAIPDLTDTRGYWAAPVHESYCRAGSVLEFWVSHGGTIYVKSTTGGQHKLLTGVDLSQPLWAVIDIYGQTCSISLLGSEKKRFFGTRRSCPAPECLTSPNSDNRYSFISDVSSLCRSSDDCISRLQMEIPEDESSVMACVVCMEKEARVTLPCGHRCLCNHCVSRVLQQFGTCPLCRHICDC